MATIFLKGTAPRAKYGSRWVEYNGVTYQSSREASFAAELDLQIRAGLIASWSRQQRMPLRVNDMPIATIVVDFVVRHLDGSREFIEVKGFPTPEWRLKWKLFCALYPTLKKRVVK